MTKKEQEFLKKHGLSESEYRAIKVRCFNCEHRSKSYSDRGCHMFKEGISNIIGTSWVDENNKCKLYKG